ncbi:MAG: RNB domain-containing ribonuclease [Nocardioidaceae bacterium]
MPRRTVNLESTDGSEFNAGISAIDQQLGIARDFPPEVLAAAEQAAAHPTLPELDRTDIPLLTIDPKGSKDLDQAMHIERCGNGFRVYYAIADVAAFVAPDGPIDVEAHKRGQTLYAPTHRIPLHPPVLSEGAASLLPDRVRPALLWMIDLDSTGESWKIDVGRAKVRSRAQLDYVAVHKALQAGSADEVFVLLKEVGELRLNLERERGGVSLPLPEQQIAVSADRWSLRYRELLPVEQWNAEISLLTGMGCAEIMLYGAVGIVRTLPPPTHQAVGKLRRTAAALHLQWPPDIDYADFVRSIDPNTPAGAAMLNACTALLRGAGYVAFDGGVPEHIEHAAIAAEYAHTTAPLRRLVDRYAGEIAVALCADKPVPDWVKARLRGLPKEMEESDQRAHQFDSAVLDLVEAGVLEPLIGDTFAGVITEADDTDPTKGSVVIQEPAVEARVTSSRGPLPLGQHVQVTLAQADKVQRLVRFELR